jgi:hypothetical protein
MFHHDDKDREMQNSSFVAVARPHPAEGVGRALQIAYRDGCELPGELRKYIERLDRAAR